MIPALRRHLFAAPQVALPRHALRSAALTLGVGALLILVAGGMLQLLGWSDPAMAGLPALRISWREWVGVVIVAPLLETALLGLMLGLLGFTRLGVVGKAVICGLLWGLLHGLVAPVWFLAPAFAFFVFSCAWLVWRPRGLARAYWAAALPHAINNAVAFAMVAAAESIGGFG